MAARSLVLMLALGGCAAHNAESPPPHETTEENAAATRAPEAPPEPSTTPTLSTTTTAPGPIQRRDLLSVLDQSPGAFLQHVDVTPRFGGGRFMGWRVVSFFPGDARFAGVDLQAGDVVSAVNGLPLEKPEQLMVVWQALRTAPALEVSLERNGSPLALRWPINK